MVLPFTMKGGIPSGGGTSNSVNFTITAPGANPPTVTVLQPMFGEPGVYTTEFWTGGNRIGAMNLNVEERKPPDRVPADRPN